MELRASSTLWEHYADACLREALEAVQSSRSETRENRSWRAGQQAHPQALLVGEWSVVRHYDVAVRPLPALRGQLSPKVRATRHYDRSGSRRDPGRDSRGPYWVVGHRSTVLGRAASATVASGICGQVVDQRMMQLGGPTDRNASSLAQ